MIADWHGVFPAVPTQFDENLNIDIEGTQKHIASLLDNGIHGLVMLGTIGENCSLTMPEKSSVLQATLEVVQGAVPVMSGIAEYTTDMACATARQAEADGVDGLMVLPAMVYKADARETVAHFRAIASATGLPIMCYNNPPVYQVDITPDMFLNLADVENIVCIKEASGDPRRITEIFNTLGDRYKVFSGLDDVALECIMLGCHGWISGLVDAFPAENRALWNAAMTGDYPRALDIYRWYMPMLRFDSHPKLVQYIKLTCQELGYGSERVRPPRLPLEGEEREEVLSIVRKCIDSRPTL
jgi:4-hydroxy-tetrahydrodipicolinate synthase